MAWESDRGFVIVVAQLLDDAVTELLTAYFQSRSDINEKELAFWFTRRPQPPLQSTGLKLKLAHSLGLIDRTLFRSLEKLQSIRSQSAAHSRDSFQITIRHVESLLEPLLPHLTENELSLIDALADKLRPEESGGSSLARRRFMNVAGFLVLSVTIGLEDMVGNVYVAECDNCSAKRAVTGRKHLHELQSQLIAHEWSHGGEHAWLCPQCKT